ncbi:MAG: hypothetical protein ACR2IB_09195 [Pyrinomonadaceae bacterium]
MPPTARLCRRMCGGGFAPPGNHSAIVGYALVRALPSYRSNWAKGRTRGIAPKPKR